MTDVHGALTAQAELLDALLAPDPPPKRRGWPLVLLALVLVTVAVAVGIVVVSRDRGPKGPPHPAKWDARVQKYVEFVEQHREIRFQHPVYVDFLTDEEFAEKVTADEKDLTDEDRTEIEQATGLLRALGLVEGDVDLFEKSNKLNGTGIIGFYSYDDERLRIRGTEITPAVESTIIHELTHALQDQAFDLGKRKKELEEADDANSSAAADGFDALVEGDARRVETMWRDSLSDRERRALDKAQKKDVKNFEDGSKDVPEVLKAMVAAPYELGQAMLAVAVQQGGERAVDDLFRSPPRTEEQQLDPWTLIADHQGFLNVPEPELADGEKALAGDDGGSFGAVGWLMVLAERVPLEQALTAVDGWGGDSAISYERDGTTCLKANYRADTPEDLTQMQTALKAWAAKGPKGAAGVTKDAMTLAFTSCDPGKNAKRVSSGRSMEALTLALTRTYLSVTLVKSGATVAMARCSADRLVRAFSLAELNNPKIDPKRVAAVVAPCRRDS
ncbi:hypothetical protein [Nocardioides halotolerans]|uniref:hypothetical protein n=1 Tax=Nocardioides halotolerans TaxID=433660 RepID=UPI0012FC3B50|nr:hypothetical protein [Nocardioides halotolerans]